MEFLEVAKALQTARPHSYALKGEDIEDNMIVWNSQPVLASDRGRSQIKPSAGGVLSITGAPIISRRPGTLKNVLPLSTILTNIQVVTKKGRTNIATVRGRLMEQGHDVDFEDLDFALTKLATKGYLRTNREIIELT
mmetsp:Transcript_131252/g.261928  ORF Transcript_131252/g.261928 Transcript_131252/m.261928 type:complete len:137 (-) Transcript_131252:2-412(-)